MQHILKPAWILTVVVLAALIAAAPAAAETGANPSPPPESSSPPLPTPLPTPAPTPAPGETTAGFVASAIPNAYFIATASRMAVAHAQSSKLRELAGELARDQTSVANALTAWVNVSGPVVTRRSPAMAQAGGGAAKLSAPRLLPAQAETLQRLSTAQGRSFDQLYVSSLMEALVRLQTLYHGFGEAGSDPGLQAIAARELPKVEKTMSALDAL